ncbi:hypothetical protein FNV43_RR00530 [Rhamnella rubrinervis]|uniref:ADP-ribosyl cyclase/cyclic ADP-ribose hydrolase n=1 Tax=Rhamnella rubrinervis TaxID=2594499 RepID=A0A8K0MS40_9ROSA|nr:hypothetical protein FNV43_RR00530 [Rhamnella rubrinervis]
MEEKRYDVFLSFRGEDTRDRFATYLYQAFHHKQILTFMDHRLEGGDEIAPTLEKIIDESAISIVIFSENYATSTWCLDELVHILDCKERNGQIVMPIFNGIDPSIVRKQKGSYKDAFAKLEERFKDKRDKVRQWRDALTEAANLSGLDSKDFRCSRCWYLGHGGIGKTTLASAVFQRFSSYFEGRSYICDVRQQYKIFGPNKLREKLFTQLFNGEDALISMDTPFVGSPFIQDRLCRKKVLIVLDDVDSSVQLETLVEGYPQLAPGSRIIVTSRNRQVLVKVAVGIYKVKGLNYIESLKLFHLHAFGRNSYPKQYYETLSERVASYAYGNPLALKVLGSFLHSRSEEEWKSALEKLKRVPNKEILDVLRISYEGLDDEGIKNIFLDIACFFDKPFTREYTESILDGGDSSAKIGISVLIDKPLLEISRGEKYFRMHDLIRQMGWSVVSDEHKEPANRSRLCNANDVCHVLEKNMGTALIEGIILNMSEMKRDVKVSPAAFSKMCNLRFLKIYCDNVDNNEFKLYLPRGLESLVPIELRYFQWDFYPLESLPSDFTPENLVELILRGSHLKQLGNHVVKELNLSECSNLEEFPEILEPMEHFDSIDLSRTAIKKLPESIENLIGLTFLSAKDCKDIISQTTCATSNCTSLEMISSETNKSCLMDIGGWRLENCSKLDQNTRNVVVDCAISCMLNAVSHKHVDYDYLPDIFHIRYPREFSYQGMGSSMNIKLPLHWKDFLGVAFCIVFDRSKADPNTLLSCEIDYGHPMANDVLTWALVR